MYISQHASQTNVIQKHQTAQILSVNPILRAFPSFEFCGTGLDKEGRSSLGRKSSGIHVFLNLSTSCYLHFTMRLIGDAKKLGAGSESI